MATVLTAANLKKFYENLTTIEAEVKNWHSLLEKARTDLNSGIGAEFSQGYPKGKKASENINTILEILQSSEQDLNALIEAANQYYQEQANANK